MAPIFLTHDYPTSDSTMLAMDSANLDKFHSMDEDPALYRPENFKHDHDGQPMDFEDDFGYGMNGNGLMAEGFVNPISRDLAESPMLGDYCPAAPFHDELSQFLSSF
jgi:hypothetical protein